MAADLSVPLAFLSLLHLANEKVRAGSHSHQSQFFHGIQLIPSFSREWEHPQLVQGLSLSAVSKVTVCPIPTGIPSTSRNSLECLQGWRLQPPLGAPSHEEIPALSPFPGKAPKQGRRGWDCSQASSRGFNSKAFPSHPQNLSLESTEDLSDVLVRSED